MIRVLTAVVLILGAINGHASPELKETAAEATTKLIPQAKRTTAEDFKLQDIKGNAHRLRQYTGKVVVISFWATWCKPCLRELSFLKTLKAKHPNKLEILAIATDGPNTASRIRPTAKRKKLTMPILLDSDGAVMASMNARGILPQSNYIDVKGNLAYTHTGFVSGDEDTIKDVITKLLSEK